MKLNPWRRSGSAGFTLIEVALALGIFALAIVSILGLLGPAVEQIEDIRLNQQANDVVSVLGADLQQYNADGETSTSAFEELFNLVSREAAVLYVFRDLQGDLEVTPNPGDVEDVDGRVFGARLSVSGVNSRDYVQPSGDIFVINGFQADSYPEAFLALRVDLHVMPTPAPGTSFEPATPTETNLLLRYHTAVNR